MEILNTHEWRIERLGYDRTSSRRTLARFHIGDTTAGQMLVDEGLARIWPDGEEWWCH